MEINGNLTIGNNFAVCFDCRAMCELENLDHTHAINAAKELKQICANDLNIPLIYTNHLLIKLIELALRVKEVQVLKIHYQFLIKLEKI